MSFHTKGGKHKKPWPSIDLDSKKDIALVIGLAFVFVIMLGIGLGLIDSDRSPKQANLITPFDKQPTVHQSLADIPFKYPTEKGSFVPPYQRVPYIAPTTKHTTKPKPKPTPTYKPKPSPTYKPKPRPTYSPTPQPTETHTIIIIPPTIPSTDQNPTDGPDPTEPAAEPSGDN